MRCAVPGPVASIHTIIGRLLFFSGWWAIPGTDALSGRAAPWRGGGFLVRARPWRGGRSSCYAPSCGPVEKGGGDADRQVAAARGGRVRALLAARHRRQSLAPRRSRRGRRRLNTYLNTHVAETTPDSPFAELSTRNFELPADVLYAKVKEAVGRLPGWEIVSSADDRREVHAVVTTKLFRFKDDVTIAVVPEPGGRPALAVRGVSRVGKGRPRRQHAARARPVRRARAGRGEGGSRGVVVEPEVRHQILPRADPACARRLGWTALEC